MIRLDWSTTDADGIDTELYEDYDQAYDRYKEIITEQLKTFGRARSRSIRTAIQAMNTSFPKRITTQTNPKFTGIYR